MHTGSRSRHTETLIAVEHNQPAKPYPMDVGSSETDRKLFSISEVCRITGLGRTTIYALISRGDLPAVKIGRRTAVRARDLDRWLATLPEREL